MRRAISRGTNYLKKMLARQEAGGYDGRKLGNQAQQKQIKHMAEEKKQEPQSMKFSGEIKVLDTTRSAIMKDYLEPIAKARGKTFHAGEVLKLAFLALAADTVGLAKGSAQRQKFMALMDATPGWFGSGNNSACRQDYEEKKGKEDVMKDYTSF